MNSHGVSLTPPPTAPHLCRCAPRRYDADLCAWAAASGYRRTDEAVRLADPRRLLAAQLAECAAPTFIRVALTEPDGEVPGRVDPDLEAHAQRFQQHVLLT
ncbi:hypothetical protein [Micromonospora sp. NPDC006431]|uniref:hypothetical protein n=1 Tax=Micromonospora sp. NPDC006431 TaxID=3364235 RepID=UPI00367812C2